MSADWLVDTNGLQIATRNTRDFADIQGLGVVNPWLAS